MRMRPITIDYPRRAVRLLRSVRGANGQEFAAGWVCGFSAQSAADLVEAGAAVYADALGPAPAVAPPPVEHRAVVTAEATETKVAAHAVVVPRPATTGTPSVNRRKA